LIVEEPESPEPPTHARVPHRGRESASGRLIDWPAIPSDHYLGPRLPLPLGPCGLRCGLFVVAGVAHALKVCPVIGATLEQRNDVIADRARRWALTAGWLFP
jgi:hypothetical protein